MNSNKEIKIGAALSYIILFVSNNWFILFNFEEAKTISSSSVLIDITICICSFFKEEYLRIVVRLFSKILEEI